MTTVQESEALTRVGAGTPMGRLMREYWLPACQSAELKADGSPLRLMLLGEPLIAFRDSAGRVGIMDHRCPHRRASLFFGRNEEGGLRCVYHGWKFDVAGKCLDMPNVPAEHAFPDKVSAKAYKAAERNGIVWAYLGARETAPPLPSFEAVMLPEAEIQSFWALRECNWLQALEGDIDTSHVGFLHDGSLKPEELAENTIHRWAVANRAPAYDVADMPWGTMYGAHRDATPGNTYYRFAHFLFPCWAMIPAGNFGNYVTARAWVPMDDTHTMFVHFAWRGNASTARIRLDGTQMPGTRAPMQYLPNTTGWYGRWRPALNVENDYGIDREIQRRDSFTGIEGIHTQDTAVTESMGAITDHAGEHLTLSDLMIVRTRRLMLRAASALAESGTVPPGVDDPEVYLGARSGDFVASAALDWREAYAAEIRKSVSPTGKLHVPMAAE
jgi:phenylpropionate dioxygenase-like ring-hydroxylating dioxygenase large terminal subunit